MASEAVHEEIPKELMDEIYAQRGMEIAIEHAQGSLIQSMWLGTLYMEGIMRFAPNGDLHIEYITFAVRLNDDGTVAFIYNGRKSQT